MSCKDQELHSQELILESLRARIAELEAENAAQRGEVERLMNYMALKDKAIFNLKKRLWNLRKDARDYRKSRNLDDFLKAREGVRALQTILAEQDEKVADIQSANAALTARLEAAEKAVGFFFTMPCERYVDGALVLFNRLSDGRFSVVRRKNGQQFFTIHSSPIAAYQAALAAGWLPADGKGGANVD